jgi:hypothetical protein
MRTLLLVGHQVCDVLCFTRAVRRRSGASGGGGVRDQASKGWFARMLSLSKSGDGPPHIVTGVGVVCSDLGGRNVHGQALALWASHVGD